MVIEQFRRLVGVEDEIGRADLEQLAAQAPKAPREPHLPATGDDQLDLPGQEVEEQAQRIPAFE